jgi:hypothetical protein
MFCRYIRKQEANIFDVEFVFFPVVGSDVRVGGLEEVEYSALSFHITNCMFGADAVGHDCLPS